VFPAFETFDDGRVLLSARRHMRHTLVAFGLASCATVLLAPPLASWFGASAWVPLAATGALSIVAFGCIHRMSRLRARVWRIATSSRHVVLLDVARRQRTVAWHAVQRIDLCDAGLDIVARGLSDDVTRLRVRSSFGPYVHVAHEIVEQAERHRVPVWIDGHALTVLDVNLLFPSLRAALAGDVQE
jgi:hypothetical protein